MQVGVRATRMNYSGMTRENMREAVKNQLIIGQQYLLKSGRDDSEDKRRNHMARCTLLEFSRNAAVFEHIDKRKETFTYQEICTMLMNGKIQVVI